MALSQPLFILMDIEGTTTAIDFVHKVLFPYSSEQLPAFVKKHSQRPDVKACLAAAADHISATLGQGSAPSQGEVIALLRAWIAADRKEAILKTLQGYIWQEGYESQAYQGHLYGDVLPALQQWQQQGIGLGIYSSGSVTAQKLLFSHSEYGDLTPLLSAYFDTQVGAKREVSSYQNIASQLKLAPQDILFLSDVPGELTAAAQAGFMTAHMVRPGTLPVDYKPSFPNFTSISWG